MVVKDNKKINPIISDKEAKSTKVNLQTTDGKDFGEVSASAYSAIRGNYLDKYSPVDDNEKNVLDSYKKHMATLYPKTETEKKETKKEKTTGRDATFWDLTINSLKRGYVQSLYGQESYKAMTGQKNNKAYYEEKLNSEDYSFIPDAWYEKALSGTMEIVGQWVRQWTDPRSVAAGTAAAGTVAVAGQAGPQIAAPEEIITVPSAFFAGIAAGSTTANFEIEAGLAYNEMIENGISSETASKIALGVGAGNAALEMIQLDDLAKSFKTLNASDATQSVAKKIASYLAKRGINVASETAQEVGQEAVTIAGVNIGNKVDKGEWAYDWNEIGQRIGETAASSAMSFGLLGTGGDVINYGINKTANTVTNKRSTPTVTATATPTKSVTPTVENAVAPNTGIENAVNPAQIANAENTTTEPTVTSTPAKVVSAGDTFKDTKTGNTLRVVNRDAENTVVEIDTGAKTEQRTYKNAQADTLVANEQFEPIESTNTETPQVNEGDVYRDTKTGNTITVVERDAENTVMQADNGVTRTMTNAQADNFATSEQTEKIESGDTETTVSAENVQKIIAGMTAEEKERHIGWIEMKLANGETNIDAEELAVYNALVAERNKAPKNITLTRVGEFYEAYGDEAVELANRLNLNLTSKTINGEKVQMVSFPAHALESFKKAYSDDYNITVSDTATETASQSATKETTDDDTSLPEVFKRDENGKIRFNQVDIDYTNNQYREETFNTLKQGGTDTETQKGGIIGKYGIHKKNNGYFGVNLLSSGMDIAAFESFDDALKFATYTNENVSFNDVSYTKNAEGRLTIEVTPEFMQYGEQIKAIKSEKAYLQTVKEAEPSETVTSINSENVPATDQNTADNSTITDIDVNNAESVESVTEPTESVKKSQKAEGNAPISEDNSGKAEVSEAPAEIAKSMPDADTSKTDDLKSEEDSAIIEKDEEAVSETDEAVSSVSEYTKDMKPMQKGKVEKTLNAPYQTKEYGLLTYADFMERSIADGRQLEERRDLKAKVRNSRNNFDFVKDVESSYNRNKAKYNAAGANNFALAKEARELRENKTGGEHIKAVDPELYYYLTGDESVLPESCFDKTYCVMVSDNQFYSVPKTVYDYGKWLEANGADASFSLEDTVEQTGVITKADVDAIQSIGRKSVNDFTSEDIAKTENFARKYFEEMSIKSPFFRAWFGDWRANDKTLVHVVTERGNARGVAENKDTGWDIQISGKVFNETKAHKMQNNISAVPYLEYINSIVENAVLLDSYSIGAKKSDNSAMMHSLYAIADMGNGRELVKLYVEELNDVNSDGTIKRSYQLQNIANQQLSVKGSSNALASSFSTADTYTISDLFALVKQNDKNFNPKPCSLVVNADGTPKIAYHGTARADRVGTVFLPERATSGPMAFFTDNRQIAENYARDKADTSIAYDEEYDDYYSQFRVTYSGTSIPIADLWNKLTLADRQKVKEAAKHITFDDEADNIVYDDNAQYGVGAFDDYTLNRHRGNAITALIENWLVDGNLYGEEHRFLDVLELAGIKNVEYRNPNARDEKVYECYLNIKNPFDTGDVNQDFYDEISSWVKSNDMSVYENETANADMWDKNNQTPESWLEKLAYDVENNSTSAWTTIPDFVTAYLKEQGYDGIKDKGGKGGGENHTVYIPFSANQIKSATDNIGTFDAGNDDIRYNLESEENSNERRNNVTARSVGRSVSESADKSGRSLYETAREVEENGGQRTDTESSRRIYAENVRAVQGTEIRQQGAFRCEFIKPDYYTDDMRAIEENNKKQGIKHTYFFLDSGEVAFKSSVKFRGAVTKNGDVYIQCNHVKYSPEQINKHEIIHRNYNTEEVKKVRAYINDNLTEDEKRYIVDVMYARYASVCKGNADKVFEEFVCDVLSGINSYSVDFANIAQEYWNAHTDLVDSYSANDYVESIDAGGTSLSTQEYADTFYSKMAKEIDGIKQDKIGAFSVVNYLKGRGVKDEEIKWSGIEEWLSDKKSVTKAELQEFAKNSMLQIETTVLNENINYTEDESKSLAEIEDITSEKWSEIATLWGEAFDEKFPLDVMLTENPTAALGKKLTEKISFDDNTGIPEKITKLAAEILTLNNNRDFIVRRASARNKDVRPRWGQDSLKLAGGTNYREILFRLPDSEYSNYAMNTHWGNKKGIVAHARVQDFVDANGDKVLFIEEIQSDWHNEGAKHGYADSKDETKLINRKSELNQYLQSRLGKNNDADEMAKIESARAEVVSINQQLRDDNQYKAPDAPFRSTYHEFVLKNLLRMAAEQGYDKLAWTTGKMQEGRWSSDYAEAYHIEYDQEIPKFLNKYGKKWGAKVGITKFDGDAVAEAELAKAQKLLDEATKDNIIEDIRMWSHKVKELQKQVGVTVPSIDITDAMRESVLYEGQPMYSIEKVNGTNKLYVKADRQVVEGATPKEWGASVEKYINNSIRQGKDVQLVAADGDILTITADTAGKAKFRNYVTRPDGTSTIMDDAEYRTKLNAESHIDELSATSKRGKKDVPDYKNHAFAKDGFNYRTAYFEDFDGQYYKVTLSVGKNGEINTVYNVGKIKEAPFPLVAQRPGTESTGGHKASTNSITDKSQNVNTEDISFSLDEDGEFDLFDLWEQKNKEFGTIKKGENPTRDVDVPKKITKDKFVSQFARTMLEAGITPDTAVSEFEKRVLDGTMTHEVVTNNSAREWAVNQIKYHGFEEALNTWSIYTRDGNVGKKELALGMELYNQCITSGDVTNAMKIAAELVAEATHAGQTLQATRMLKLMTPDGQLYYLEKSIQKMNDEFKKKIGDKYEDIELNEELMEKFLTEKEADKRDEIYDDICQDIADQIPPTLLDKWNSWRYLAMLGNPRTHIRNIAGNAVFTPAIRVKNYIGAVIEKVAKIDTSERTKSLHKNKKAVEFAKNDFAKMLKVLQGENAKYAVTSDIEGKRTIFKTKGLEKLRNKNFEWLEKEDMWFLKMHYVDALAQIITARNLDVDSIDEKTLDTARAYAVREAQRATYRDANSLAEALNKLQKKAEHSDKKAVRAANILLEGVMPFKKTPLNIAKQGVQYSPVGILSGVYKTVSKIKDGDAYSTTDIIDDFAKGLTGTALMLLGTFLALLGIISGGDDENKKKKEFDKMVGEQSFSLNIGDKSYTIDWAAPTCLPLFTGVELYELTKDDFKFADITAALSSLTDPLLELSVFSGISGAIEAAQYNDTNTLFAIGSDMTTSYLTQALPTVGGQISRIIDKNKREYYYTDKNSNLPKGVQNFIGQVSSKIPFASYLFEPSIDEWGREETYGGVVERTLENVVSPGYYSEKNYTVVDEEIKRLYESTGDADVLPVIQQKKYTTDYVDYPMTAAQYTKAKQLRGQRSFELIEQLLSDGMRVKLQNKQTGKYQTMTYSLMSDEEKVRAIKKCYEQAGDETKEIMLEEVKGNR